MNSIISSINIKLYGIIILIISLLVIDYQLFAEDRLKDMTLEEKIGQLFIIPACELRGTDHEEDLEKLIVGSKVGGVLLKQGTVQGQMALIEKLQNLASLPLLCLQDGEYGVAMRLRDALSLPRQLTLGAVQDLSLIYRFGQEIGRQCNLVGVQMVLGPDVDVNCNARNPIIHMRSFGEDPVRVAQRGEMVMRGIQSMGIIACAKHFPGHGDTTTDSHVDLPVVSHDFQRLQKVELYPFQKLIDAGVDAVMSAHLYVTELADEPATFSTKLLTRLLKEQMGFSGLLISDALNMKALSNHYSPGEIAVRTLKAGHDLLLYGDHIAPKIDQILKVDVPQGIEAVKFAVENHEISEELIDSKVRKILQAKEKCGLFASRLKNINEKLNSPEAFALKKQLFEEAITVVRNEGMIPLQKQKIALVKWGESSHFQGFLESHFEIEAFSLLEMNSIPSDCSCIVISLSQYTTAPPHFGLSGDERRQLADLSTCGIPCVAVLFGTPYSLADVPLFESIIVAYENEIEAQEAAANVLMGKLIPKGRLPISVPHFPAGTGF